MEKIKLLELDIDIDALKKNMTSTMKTISDLTEQQKLLKKSSIDLGIEIEKKTKIMQQSEKENKTNTASYRKLKQEVEQLKTVQSISSSERKTQLTEVTASLKAQRKAYNLGIKMVDAYTEKEMKNLSIISQVDGSIDQLSTALSNNKAVYKSLTKEERENTKIGGKLLTLIQAQDDEYKKLNIDIGNTGVQVGNYKEEMKKAIAETGIFSHLHAQLLPVLSVFKATHKAITSQFKLGAKEIRTYSQAQTLATKATKVTTIATRLLSGALMATGIPIIVAAIAALVSWFKRSQTGADKFGQVLSQITSVVDVFVDRISKIGSILGGVLFEQKSLTEAWSEGKEALSGMGDEMQREWELSKKLEIANQKLEKSEQLLAFQRSANNTKIKELNKTVEDTTKSTQDRLAAAQEIERIETAQADKELENANKRLSLALGKEEVDKEALETLKQLKDGTIEYDELLGKIGLSESTAEDVEKLLEAFDESEAAQQRSLEIRTTNQNKLNTILKESEAKRDTENKAAIERAKKETESALKESKKRLDIYIAENENKNKTLKEQLAYEQTVHDKKIEILKDELKAKKLNQSEYDLEVLAADNELLQKRADLTISHAEKELDLYIAKNKSKIDDETELTDALVAEEEKRLQSIYEKELEFLEQEKEAKLISEQDYQLKKIKLDEQFLEQKKELQEQFDVDKQKRKTIQLEIEQKEFETELELRKERGELTSKLELERLERDRVAAVKKAKEEGRDIEQVEQLYAAKRMNIEQEVSEAKYNQKAELFNNVAYLLGEETALGKASAIAAVIAEKASALSGIATSTQLANMKAVAASPLTFGQPWVAVNTITGGIAAAASVAAGAQAIGDINKAEHGAVFDIGGQRHSAGGTKFYGEDGTTFEAEKGEKMFVLNRIASRMLGPGLSKINEMYGGVPLSQSSSFLAQGGAVSAISSGSTRVINNTTQQSIDYDKQAAKIGAAVGEANKSLPHPVTDVKDVINEVSNYNKIVDGANI